MHELLSPAALSDHQWVAFVEQTLLCHFSTLPANNDAYSVTAFNVLLQVCCSGLVSAYTPATEQGFALGTLSAVTSVVSMLGPALFGSLYSWAKGPPMDFPQLPFVLAGVLSTMSFSVAAVPPRGS